jgi:hypothetical protein
MAMARMITGTIIGEMIIVLTNAFPGKLPLVIANEARVPTNVAITVVQTAT